MPGSDARGVDGPASCGYSPSELAPGGEESGGEPNPEVDRLLHETEPQGTDKTIAFLGEVGAGKTVVAALLKHTLSTKWVPGSNGRWDALTVSGTTRSTGPSAA